MSELLLFGAAFVHVFGLGLQNLNVVRGHFVAAFLTSFLIGVPFVLGVTMLPAATLPERIAFLLGGAFGIVTAMWAHPWLAQLKRPRFIHRKRKETT